jgi:hypothetical protein
MHSRVNFFSSLTVDVVLEGCNRGRPLSEIDNLKNNHWQPLVLLLKGRVILQKHDHTLQDLVCLFFDNYALYYPSTRCNDPISKLYHHDKWSWT